MNKIAIEYGQEPLKYENIEEFRALSLWEMFRRSKLPFWKIYELSKRVRKEITDVIDHIPMFPGIYSQLELLKERGHKLFLISSNSDENVEKFIKNYDIKVFEDIIGDAGLWSKHRVIKKHAEKHGWNIDDVIYIGDESRDIKASKRAGVKCVAVSWGFNNREHLEKFHPDLLIDTPSELIKLEEL